MAAIDRDELLEDVKFWLPSSNTINDAGLNKLNELIISSIGDDNTKYAEVLCGCLNFAAEKNAADADASIAGLKKSKIGDIEEQYYSGNTASAAWSSYIDKLPGLCSGFGYTEETPETETLFGKISINCGDKFDVDNEFTQYTTTDIENYFT